MRNPLSAILQSADSIVSTLSGDAPILNEQVVLSAAAAEDLIDAAQTIILCGQHQKREQSHPRPWCTLLTLSLSRDRR